MRMLLWLTAALAAGLYIVGPVSDPDLWWHITVGKWIIAHREIPAVDYWNIFGVNKPWRAYSWSNEIIFALVDSRFGAKGLLVSQMALAVLYSLTLCWVFGRIARDYLFGALLGVFVTGASYNHFSLRPQILIWILFALLLELATRAEKNSRSGRLAVQVFLIMCLWANSHLSAALGLLALGIWLWGEVPRGTLFKLLGAGFLGTLFTPYIGGEWVTLISKVSHPFKHGAVAEFQPMNILQYSTVFFILLLLLSSLFLHFAPHRKFSAKAVGFGIFALGGLAVGKFLPMACIFSGAFVAYIWAYSCEQQLRLGNFSEAINLLRAKVEEISPSGLAWVFLCLSFLFVMNLWSSPLEEALIPQRQIDLILRDSLPRPVLTDFTHGGYLMYRLANERGELAADSLVAIDGRTNVTPPEVFKKFDAALVGKRDWKDFIDLINPGTILWPTESPLSSILRERSEWCLVDEQGSATHGFSLFVTMAEFLRRPDTFGGKCNGKIIGAPPAAENSATPRAAVVED